MLYGGWATGESIGDEDSKRHLLGLLATHWGLGSDLLTDLFAPDADAGTRRARQLPARGVLGRDRRRAAAPRVRAGRTPGPPPRHGADAGAAPHRGPGRTDRGGPELAGAIPNAEFVELEGRSHLPAIGDAQAVVDEVRRFLGLPRLRRDVPTGLTARQTEVAALVAQGLTNRELADRLHITERSAESHLERIRLRLGFRSRAQVAAWYVATTPQVR